ncbi:hypothetical protein R1Y13_13540 [Pseudomonas sp. NY8938]|uniref:hypothetical protein n=1 Tax=Pseudomonas sp. NY8938 TaxID=3081664 RepID=UPI003857F449
MDTNKMREQFESVAREVLDWSDDEFRLASDGKSYYWGATGEAWVFWQASREAVVVALPKDIVTMAGPVLYADDVRAAIAAQGLKVEVKP